MPSFDVSETDFATTVRTALGVLALGATLLWPAAATAHGAAPASGAPPSVSELPPSPVKRQLLDLNKQLRDGNHPRELIAQPLDDAVRAASRARGARAAGDKLHGAMLDKLAAQWANAAKAILRAAVAEKAAAKVAARLQDFTTKVKRAEALLTEQQARLGRLQEQVRKAEKRYQDATNRAAKAEAKRLDAAAEAAGKRSRKPGKRAPAKPKGAR